MTATAAPPATGTANRRPQSGPPLLAPVLAFTGLTIAYVVANRSTPHPDASGLEVLHYAGLHGTTIKVGAFLLFASAVPLAVTAAVLYRRLRALGITAPGSAITLVGGVLASCTLTLSALFGWAGGRLPATADPALARALADLGFLAGGPGYAVMFALLIAGVSVTGLLAGLLPRAATWIGLLLAAVGMVSSLTLLGSGFGYLLPAVRFGGLIWLVAAAALLPRTRPSRHQ
ncbi:DUF4386 domain-containing protein [Frankia sp. AgB1.9]|uniref:DUF4386 domain-containing protein n=1 Tax=unclassified Frankia TaxID=2632575 RepID=UPI001933F4E8|nr:MULTISPECIES: DUF4386 domain-containing protein [unclassified Frankia]MBL7493036.1 DUF4386 domain-containing protein [Frankia sp. AgW1.1]MBL7553447.1 DUF4386 domain-containing protein [Frankia sp. AgB1.9]MBL7619770.1 DUF4386 domain-containing protein [Frankia sp. AgB1.8]